VKRKAAPGFEVGPRSWYKLADTCAGATLSFTRLGAANGSENIVIRRLRDYIPRNTGAPKRLKNTLSSLDKLKKYCAETRQGADEHDKSGNP